MLRVVEPVRIHEVRVLQSQACGRGIHFLHEPLGRIASCALGRQQLVADESGHGAGRVVAGIQHQPVHHLFDGQDVAGQQTDHRLAIGDIEHVDLVGGYQLLPIGRVVGDHQRGHQLGRAGGRATFVGSERIERRFGGRVDDIDRLRGDIGRRHERLEPCGGRRFTLGDRGWQHSADCRHEGNQAEEQPPISDSPRLQHVSTPSNKPRPARLRRTMHVRSIATQASAAPARASACTWSTICARRSSNRTPAS